MNNIKKIVEDLEFRSNLDKRIEILTKEVLDEISDNLSEDVIYLNTEDFGFDFNIQMKEYKLGFDFEEVYENLIDPDTVEKTMIVSREVTDEDIKQVVIELILDCITI